MPCVSTADLATIIRDGPARLAMEGIGFDGRLFQMTVNPADGAWLLWVTAPGAKLSCIGVGGEDLKLGVPPKASADDPA